MGPPVRFRRWEPLSCPGGSILRRTGAFHAASRDGIAIGSTATATPDAGLEEGIAA
jgi:hypothetical protein